MALCTLLLWCVVLGGCAGEVGAGAPDAAADASQADDAAVAAPTDAATAVDAADASDGGGAVPEDAGTLEPDGSLAQDASAPADDAAISADGSVDEDAACSRDDFQLKFNTPDPTRAVFDPNEITLAGTLRPGSCGYDAVAPWYQPNLPLMGFGCRASQRVIRPSDGRMLYLDGDTNQLRVFACDGCTYVHPQDRYRYDYAANDPVVPTPACDAANPPAAFLLSPEGRVVYRCGTKTVWYDEAGAEVLAGANAFSYGVDGWLLLADRLFSVDTGTSVAIQGLPSDLRWLARRATASGFWIATSAADVYDPAHLWHVALNGEASWLGTYPDAPSVASTGFLNTNALDALGRLYQITRKNDQPDDVIMRRELNGSSEIIYDELDRPILQVHISDFVTGPGAFDESKQRAWGGEITTPYCPSRDELWTYTAPSVPVEPPPTPVPIPSPAPGPGVACGATRCAGGTEVCCAAYPDTAGTTPPSCKLHRDHVGNLSTTCAFPAVYAACDQSSDCATPDDDPNDPAVCCFITGVGAGSRECTTARLCAGSATKPVSAFSFSYTGILACQQDADCALAAQPSRCISDGVITGSASTHPQVGRCEGTVVPPDGTTLLSSSVLCGDAMCSREASRSCCHTGTRTLGNDFGEGVLSMESPQCGSACYDGAGSQYFTHSYCDEPSDCRDPLAIDPANPFECCFVQNPWGGPWHRECQQRQSCRFFACQSDSDCKRIHPKLSCRPERTLTGGGMARPEVRSCQTP